MLLMYITCLGVCIEKRGTLGGTCLDVICKCITSTLLIFWCSHNLHDCTCLLCNYIHDISSMLLMYITCLGVSVLRREELLVEHVSMLYVNVLLLKLCLYLSCG